MSICLDHERSSAMVTPKYFAAGALSSSTLCRMYLVLRGFALFVIWRTWHLEGLNCIFHIFSHCSRLARSVCRTSLSVVELFARYKAVSSAKSLTLNLTCSGWSFMYVRKRIGPRVEPCGTPEETGVFSELIPLITTACFRLSKKSFIHFRVFLWCHNGKVLGVTLSKA